MFAVENGNERARCNYGVYLMGLVVIDLKGKGNIQQLYYLLSKKPVTA